MAEIVVCALRVSSKHFWPIYIYEYEYSGLDVSNISINHHIEASPLCIDIQIQESRS